MLTLLRSTINMRLRVEVKSMHKKTDNVLIYMACLLPHEGG